MVVGGRGSAGWRLKKMVVGGRGLASGSEDGYGCQRSGLWPSKMVVGVRGLASGPRRWLWVAGV